MTVRIRFQMWPLPHLTSPDKLLPEKYQNIFRLDATLLDQNLLVTIHKGNPSQPRASFFSSKEFCTSTSWNFLRSKFALDVHSRRYSKWRARSKCTPACWIHSYPRAIPGWVHPEARYNYLFPLFVLHQIPPLLLSSFPIQNYPYF